MAKLSKYPWGRCSKAVRGQCKRPCKKFLAHHIQPWGGDWCMCEPVVRPLECKSWAAYNRALRLQIAAEGQGHALRAYPNGDPDSWYKY